MQLQRDVPLAPLTTIRLGGIARYFVEVESDSDVKEAVKWAADANVGELFVLGGGSNIVVADTGIPGLVMRTVQKGIRVEEQGNRVLVSARAGERWDDLVAHCVEQDLSGVECLSGIPGCVGATPIQNVGAYGQEVGQTIASVTVFDRVTRERVTLSREDCGFAYRDSRFKSREPSRFVVLSVTFRLSRKPPALPSHREILERLAEKAIAAPTVQELRTTVLEVRERKSMLESATDPLARSAGSFFVNPIVTKAVAREVQQSAGDRAVPSWDMPDGMVKLAAAWLIESSGFCRGYRAGTARLSPHHCLVLIADERAQSADIVALASQIQYQVRTKFHVELEPEPRFWGFQHFSCGLPMLDENGPSTLDSASLETPPCNSQLG